MDNSKYLTIKVSETTYSKLKVISTITNTPMTTLFYQMIESPVFLNILDAAYYSILDSTKEQNDNGK